MVGYSQFQRIFENIKAHGETRHADIVVFIDEGSTDKTFTGVLRKEIRR